MFVTLLLPIVVPYGEPITFFNPTAAYFRRVEFFKWIESIEIRQRNYRYIPLLKAEDLEIEGGTLIEGEQDPNPNFVPSTASA